MTPEACPRDRTFPRHADRYDPAPCAAAAVVTARAHVARPDHVVCQVARRCRWLRGASCCSFQRLECGKIR
jgi:hypothetical protein